MYDYDYATSRNQQLILEEIQEINSNYQEMIPIYKNMNIGIYCILFILALNLTIEIVKKALYTR